MQVRQGSRVGAALVTIMAGVLATTLVAAPAWAHVTVTADNAQAGARNVTVTFVSEAESSKAGIASARVILPAGISPQDVRLGKAPDGWTFAANPDGYTVSGKALPVGKDATYSVVIAQLPTDATELAFKTLDTYGDGSVKRWIEIPVAGQAEPDNPAPLLKLSPAATAVPNPAVPNTAVPNTAASSTAAPTPATPTDAAPPTNTPTVSTASVAGTGWWVAAAVVVIIVAITTALLLARRRRQTPPTAP